MRRYNVCVEFGEKVQRARKKLGVSQEELASRVKVHRNHMGRIERGETNPPLYTVFKITKALKLKSASLLPF